MSGKPPITIAVAGARGKMGREALEALQASSKFRIVGTLVRTKPGEGAMGTSGPIPAYTDVEQLLMEEKPQVWLDFTDASTVVTNVDMALQYGVHPVIGATGYSEDDLARWRGVCDGARIGAIAAPNFAIGALLMIKFSKEAARFYHQVEIVELHHAGKKDAPSGTAHRTAEAINQVFQEGQSLFALSTQENGQAQPAPERMSMEKTAVSKEVYPSRGMQVGEVGVHSIRLPGLVAHQEVLFGGNGEVLTVRHDSMSRSSFMPGVLFACSKVTELSGLVYGLENLLW